MEWTKIPTDLLQSRTSDKEILAVVKYQLLWAILERKPDDNTALRYMTLKQLQQACNYTSAIKRCVNADIKSVENHRKRQKIIYEKNQELKRKADAQTNTQTTTQTNTHTAGADKIRLDKIREEKENPKRKRPTLDEIRAWCKKNNSPVNPDNFFNHYEGVGWKSGGQDIVNWQALIKTWRPDNKEQAEASNIYATYTVGFKK